MWAKGSAGDSTTGHLGGKWTTEPIIAAFKRNVRPSRPDALPPGPAWPRLACATPRAALREPHPNADGREAF